MQRCLFIQRFPMLYHGAASLLKNLSSSIISNINFPSINAGEIKS